VHTGVKDDNRNKRETCSIEKNKFNTCQLMIVVDTFFFTEVAGGDLYHTVNEMVNALILLISHEGFLNNAEIGSILVI